MPRIAMAQINPTVGAIEANKRKIIRFIDKARLKAELVTFPELALTGYPPEDLLLKPHFVRDNICAIKDIAKSAGVACVVGFVDRDSKGNIYNAAALISGGRIKGVYHKIKLPNYGVFDEKRYFKEGKRPFIFKLGGEKFGITICEDIWDESVAKSLKKLGAAAIINISSSPYYAGKRLIRERLIQKQARPLKVAFFYNNLVGGQDELVFDGGSMAFDSAGRLIACGRQFEEDLIIAEVQRRPKRGAPVKSVRAEPLGKYEEIYKALVLGTRDYVKKSGFKKVVAGLSGGIDSSLVAAVACDALGRKNLIGVSMPSMYTSSASVRDAERLSENLGIKLMNISIDGIYRSYLKALAGPFKNKRRGTAEENLQARIRGAVLMALSNKFGWLVLTTGNKSETAVGYCTLYGDMAGGFAVLKDVPKTLVYKLAEYRNRPEAIIPKDVFKKAPTAELRPNQRDSDSIPRYSRLDPILKGYVEEDKGFDELSGRGYSRRTLKKVIGLVDTNEYKRRQAPPGVKITPKAFGKDRRLPIVNGYRESC